MRSTVFKSKAIKTIIIIVAVLLILSVFPFRMWKKDYSIGTKPVSGNKSEVINYRNNFTEVFVAAQTHLQSISLYLAEGTYPDEFQVELTDGSGKHMASETVMPGDIPGYVEVLMDEDTVPGELYILKITSLRSVYFGLEDFDPAAGLLVVPYYNDVPVDNKSMVVDFNYRVPYGLADSLLIIGIVVLSAAVLIALTTLLYQKRKDKLLTVETVVKWVGNPLTALLLAACFFFIVRGDVSTFVQDNIFAAIATVLMGGVMFYGINHRRYSDAVITVEYPRTHIGDLVQSLGIAYAIQGCCEYVSGLYDINHYVAERKEMIGLAVAIIAMFSFGEVVNWYNILCVIAGIIGGVAYYRSEAAKLIPENITGDDLFVLKGNAIIATLLVIILIRTIKVLIQKRISKPNILLSAVTAVYFVLIIVFRNTRWWTVAMVVSFVLVFVNYGSWNKKENFLTNLIRGVVIQFVMCTAWCLLHRPYASYGSSRYTHFFHTETITATYMTMVLCVAAVMIIQKTVEFTKTESDTGVKFKLEDIWKELALFGVVASYLIFTLSRTAFAAAMVALFFLAVLTFVRLGRKNVSLVFKSLLCAVAAVIIMLPITFEVQRTLPCLVSDPMTYDIEGYSEKVLHGRQLNSTDYIPVGRFANLFGEKILGMDEGFGINYYNTDVEYNEYQASLRDIYYAADGYHFTEFDISDEGWDLRPTEEQFDAYIYRDCPRDENGKLIGSYELMRVWGIHLEGDPLEAASKEESETGEEFGLEDGTEGSSDNMVADYTNGRLDIYKSYIEQLNMTGHDSMGAVLENGEIATHAHDVYLQVAYDHGIPTAVVFVIFGMTLLVMGIIFFMKQKDKYDALSMTLIIAFAVAGVVEWVFHLSHPMSFVMLLSATPLMFMHNAKKRK